MTARGSSTSWQSLAEVLVLLDHVCRCGCDQLRTPNSVVILFIVAGGFQYSQKTTDEMNAARDQNLNVLNTVQERHVQVFVRGQFGRSLEQGMISTLRQPSHHVCNSREDWSVRGQVALHVRVCRRVPEPSVVVSDGAQQLVLDAGLEIGLVRVVHD